MKDFQRLLEVRRGGIVSRYHTIRTSRTQTNADHSFHVAMICIVLFPDCRKELLIACLTHDLSEHITGDIPAHGKWDYPDLSKISEIIHYNWINRFEFYHQLTDDEKTQLQICDYLELMFFCDEEMRMGNFSEAIVAFDRTAKRIEEKNYHLYSKTVGSTFNQLVNTHRRFRDNGV